MSRLARSLQRGYDCAILDTIEQTGNDSCVPWDSDYTAGVAMGGVDDPNGIWSIYYFEICRIL